MKTQKVFCIGWHKTGTTTLGDALLILGYKVMGARLDFAEPLLKNEIDFILEDVKFFDALQDMPWAALYEELDRNYPNSKFILTIRDEESWLNSASRHFKDLDVPLHKWLYGKGVLKGNEEIYLNRYRAHNVGVMDYFRDRPRDLLIMDFSKGHGWVELCNFLETPIPRRKFPHSNKAKHSFTAKDKVLDYLRNLVPLPIRLLRMKILKFFGVPDPRHRFHNRLQNEKVRDEIFKK